MTRSNRLAAVALALAAAGCNPDFPPQYRVTDLRILGVRSEIDGSSDVADADLGDRVWLSALVANPLGRAPLRVRWAACLPDGTERLSPCLDPDALRDVDRLLASAGVIALGEGTRIPVGVSGLFVTLDSQLSAALDALIARGEAEPAYTCQLYLEVPVLVVAEAGDRREIAVKRVRVTPWRELANHPTLAGAYPPNENPGVSGVQVAPDEDACGTSAAVPVAAPCGSACVAASCAPDGYCDLAFPDGERVLCGIARPTSSERFDQCSPTGERTSFHESLDWQWYVTDGTFPDAGGVGNAVGVDVAFERPAGAFTLWTIVRDGRGGEGWLTRTFGPR